MADINLDFEWDITADGDLEISISPVGSDADLGTFVLDSEEILSEFEADIEAHEQNPDEFNLYHWEEFAEKLQNLATTIFDRVREVEIRKHNRRINMINFLSRMKEDKEQ